MTRYSENEIFFMKKNIRIFCFFFVVLLVLPLFFASCENPPEKTEGISETGETKTGSVFLEDFSKTAESAQTEETTPTTKEISEEDAEWNEALKKHSFEDGLVWLVDFANSHPDSKYMAEALELLEKIRGDSSYSEKYLSEPTLEKIDEFISKFPGHKDIGKARQQRKEFSGEIGEMIKKGTIAAISAGESTMRNIIQIQNKTDSKLEVTIPFGTYFAANSGNVQNMLARREKSFLVKPNQIGVSYIETACMNIYKDAPGEKSYFTVDMLAEDSRLIKLLKILDDNNSSYEIAQAAIWHMADNPGKEAILEALVYENGERAITQSDYEEALRLVALAVD